MLVSRHGITYRLQRSSHAPITWKFARASVRLARRSARASNDTLLQYPHILHVIRYRYSSNKLRYPHRSGTTSLDGGTEDAMADPWAAVRTPEDLGRFLARVRQDHGLAQEELAQDLGVSRRYVSEIENGKPGPVHGAPVSDVAPSWSATTGGASLMTARKPLDVWLYGTQVATITDHGREIRLQWSQGAYERWGQGGRVVSHLLPIDRPSVQPHHRRAQAFLAGLLPEGNARERHAQAAGVTSDDIFGMIRAYGKETAGALIFVEQGSPKDDPHRLARACK